MAEDEISKLKQDLTNLQGELESLDQKNRLSISKDNSRKSY